MRLGHVVSSETRAKISATLTGHVRWGPEHQTPETRAKIAAANTGKISPKRGIPLSEETKAKMSATRKGKPGRPQSPESRAKLSAASTGKTQSPETRAKISATLWKGGRETTSRRETAKRRSFGFVPLNAVFPGCEGHHVNNEQVINMPKVLHRSIYHRQSDGRGMAKINAIAYNFLFKQEVEAAIATKESS